ncbi:MAG: alpha/beta hydrolase [Rhodospirillales bacterium]|nr:alpha/beta hydrolase [Rhodospirillales bacterium]
MTDAIIFRDYSQSQLDSQYNNRAHVPDHVEIYEVRKAEGDAALGQFQTHLDVPYGLSGEETLDIFFPENPTQMPGGAPINIFFHGGYWFSRHKDDFRWLANGLAARGGILVIVNYALIPDVDLDELVQQCRASVAWVFDNAETFGGDKNRIFVSGHSAGGHLTAMMMATDWPALSNGLPADLIKGGTAISGIYDLEPIRLGFMQETLGFTAEQVAAYSPVGLTPKTKAPMIVVVGGSETDEFIRQSKDFAEAWGKSLSDLQEQVPPGLNHFTVLDEFAAPETELMKAVAKQMGLD